MTQRDESTKGSDWSGHRAGRASGNGWSDDGATVGGSMGALMGAAAVGFAAGMAANMARKMVTQAPAALQGDWVAALTAEHRTIEAIFDQILQTKSSDTAKRLALLKSLKGGLGKHAFKEENVIYPALQMNGVQGEARQFAEDHTEMKTFLHELTMTAPDAPGWIETLQTLRELVLRHMREEENDVFPTLRERLSTKENAKLGMMAQKEALKLA